MIETIIGVILTLAITWFLFGVILPMFGPEVRQFVVYFMYAAMAYFIIKDMITEAVKKAIREEKWRDRFK